MLTLDLVRVRKSKGEIKPRYIKESKKLLEKAEILIGLYDEHIDKTQGELEEAIKDLIGDGTDYLLQRGLSKLLADRSEFEMAAPVDPREIRQKVFELSAEHHPVAMTPDLHHQITREDVLRMAGESFGLDVAQMNAALYADLKDAYILKSFKSITPEKLLRRYNVALAQAVLFRAREMRIMLRNANTKRLRQLIRYVKFFRLIADIRPTDDGYFIVIDGPGSLFRFSQKYGLQMASFLPALLLCEDWNLEVEIRWEEKQRELHTFTLESDGTLHSHFPDKGQYVTEEESYFRKRWKDYKSAWALKPSSKIVKLGAKDLLVVDYVLTHEDGRKVLLELVGFWHKRSLVRKLEAIEEYGPDNLILVVPAKLRVSEDELPETQAAVYFFKNVIQPKQIVALAEELSS